MAKQPASSRTARPYNNVGYALLRGGKPEEAVPYFEKALSLDPDDPEIHSNLGYAFSLAGQHQKALEQLMTALSMAPGLMRTHLALGDTLTALGREEDAAVHYSIAGRL